MTTIKNQIFSEERALYNSKDLELIKCDFKGEEDGESALKESDNIKLFDCFMDLRYPLWHDNFVELKNITMTENCRAALWYSNNVLINDSYLGGIKALRECRYIEMKNTKVVSPEFGWRSKDIKGTDLNIKSEYCFFEAENMEFDHLEFEGKYSFQYVKNLNITNSILKTKDAFWHASDVVVRDSIIEGEYLGWYSKNLTFINCKIKGTQPLCYCDNLKIINCEMINADLSFEYSDVEADVIGKIESVKNPKSGVIKAKEIGEIIITEDSKYEVKAKIK